MCTISFHHLLLFTPISHTYSTFLLLFSTILPLTLLFLFSINIFPLPSTFFFSLSHLFHFSSTFYNHPTISFTFLLFQSIPFHYLLLISSAPHIQSTFFQLFSIILPLVLLFFFFNQYIFSIFYFFFNP